MSAQAPCDHTVCEADLDQDVSSTSSRRWGQQEDEEEEGGCEMSAEKWEAGVEGPYLAPRPCSGSDQAEIPDHLFADLLAPNLVF